MLSTVASISEVWGHCRNSEVPSAAVKAEYLLCSLSFCFVEQLRQGIPMPTTVGELYRDAAEAMLERGGVASGDLRRLLQRVFFDARVANERVITGARLQAAARAIGVSEEALKEFEQRVCDDRMPLLSLLTAEPLEMQCNLPGG